MSVHIGATEGQIAEKVLMPVDSEQAQYIATTYLKDAQLVSEVRGMLCFTGSYEGIPVSVMGTGMGMPSTGIYVTELIRFYGAKAIVHLTGARSFGGKLGDGELLLSQGACTNSKVNRMDLGTGTYTPIADFLLLRAAEETAEKLGCQVAVGNILSTDLLYGEPTSKKDAWKRHGVLAEDMETAYFYTIAGTKGVPALSILLIDGEVDKHCLNRPLAEKTDKAAYDDGIKLALETLRSFG